MGTVDIKLDKDYTVILDLALLTDFSAASRGAATSATKRRAGAKSGSPFLLREHAFGKMPTTPLPSAAILR